MDEIVMKFFEEHGRFPTFDEVAELYLKEKKKKEQKPEKQVQKKKKSKKKK